VTQKKYNVLFVGFDNSARSLIAECLINRWGIGKFNGYSAGTRSTGDINPFTKWILEKNQYVTDVLNNKSMEMFTKSGASEMDFVITLCDEVDGDAVSELPGNPIRAHWNTENPTMEEGLDINKKAAFQRTFSELENRISIFVNLPFDSLDKLKLKQRLDEIGGSRATAQGTDRQVTSSESNAKALVAYSFLVVFANDDTIDEGELAMIERLALADGVVDDEERKVLSNLFSRVNKEQLTEKVWQEMENFRAQNNI
jgi:arsenate reductase